MSDPVNAFDQLVRVLSDSATEYVQKAHPQMPQEQAFEFRMELMTFGLRFQVALTEARRAEKPCKCRLLPTESGANAYTDRSECTVHKGVVHILDGGRALCDQVTGVPASWPSGHFWVRLDEAKDATCERCQQARLVLVPV